MLHKHIFSIILASAGIAANAAEPATPDTVMHAIDVDVVVTESSTGLNIKATNSEYALSHFEKYPENTTIQSTQSRLRMPAARISDNKSTIWNIISGQLRFGFVNAPGAPASLDIEMGKSLEISWLNTLAMQCYIKNIHSSVSAGIGLTWRNYRTTTGMRFTSLDNGDVGFAPFSENQTPKYSRLKVFSLSFPILFTHYFNIPRLPNVAIQLGPVLNWNSHASIESKWIDELGRKQKEGSNNVGQRHFTVDLYAALRVFSDIGIYVRYSPQSVLCNPQLDFTTFSTGIAIGI